MHTLGTVNNSCQYFQRSPQVNTPRREFSTRVAIVLHYIGSLGDESSRRDLCKGAEPFRGGKIITSLIVVISSVWRIEEAVIIVVVSIWNCVDRNLVFRPFSEMRGSYPTIILRTTRIDLLPRSSHFPSPSLCPTPTTLG